jgi:hypothetical protein
LAELGRAYEVLVDECDQCDPEQAVVQLRVDRVAGAQRDDHLESRAHGVLKLLANVVKTDDAGAGGECEVHLRTGRGIGRLDFRGG